MKHGPSRKRYTIYLIRRQADLKTSDSSSTASTTKRKRNTWSTEEEEILLNLCREHKSGLKGSGSSQKWQQIADEVNRGSDEINASSSLKTGTQCRHKWHNLLNAYKKGRTHLVKLKMLQKPSLVSRIYPDSVGRFIRRRWRTL